MAVKIDPDVCGHIANCPVQGLCIKLCEQGAIIEEDGDVKVVPENCDDCDLCIPYKIVQIKLFPKHEG